MKKTVYIKSENKLAKQLRQRGINVVVGNVPKALHENASVKTRYVGKVPELVLMEQLFIDTIMILSESGSLPGVEQVPSEIADKVVKDFLDRLVKPTGAIEIDSAIGIGSTRKILNKLPDAKKMSGDLDLLALANKDRKSATDALVAKAKAMGIDYQVAFGNVFSVAYPYNGAKYQVDLMVVEKEAGDAAYQYMQHFKYWADEPTVQNTPYVIKGAHRGEITRTIIKAVGLSATETAFVEFVWNNKYNDIEKLAVDLQTKAQKFRDDVKKSETLKIAEILRTKIKTLDALKKFLFNKDGSLKNRYSFGIFKHLRIGYQVLIDAITEKQDTPDNWEQVLDRKFGIKNVYNRMRQFWTAIDLVVELVKKGAVTRNAVVQSFIEMKKNFFSGKAGIAWNEQLEADIEKKLPFLKGKW